MDFPNHASDNPLSFNDSNSQSDSRPGLLPAFEPTSSPRLPRPSKRKHDGSPIQPRASLKHYPTPIPTSSTGITTSPPPPHAARPTRPLLQRTASTVSERVPLGDVRGLELNINGDPILLGRSSNSSQYQLSANRLISRVHVKATYHGADDRHENGRVTIECLGWNGLRIQCQGYTTDLNKGDTFTSTRPHAEIMVGVQDARVLIRWPAVVRKDSAATLTDSNWAAEESPSRPTPPATPIPSSPPIMQTHLRSPVSPSPRARPPFTASSTFLGLPGNPPSSPPAVLVYEDEKPEEDQVEPAAEQTEEQEETQQRPPPSATKQSAASPSLSPPEDFSDHDEENDPIVHSFGPFGANLLPRMASFSAVSPERRRDPLRTSVSPRQPKLNDPGSDATISRSSQHRSFRSADMLPITNHVINQLAFSRLHSLPLSTIMSHLPAALKAFKAGSTDSFDEADLRLLLEDIPCVGEIAREGKDAAGKALENEYYYVPEMDADEGRRTAVEIGKPGIRSVRKQHKQYFWKRPRV